MEEQWNFKGYMEQKSKDWWMKVRRSRIMIATIWSHKNLGFLVIGYQSSVERGQERKRKIETPWASYAIFGHGHIPTIQGEESYAITRKEYISKEKYKSCGVQSFHKEYWYRKSDSWRALNSNSREIFAAYF